MAAIGEIRKRSGLLLIIIGGALLLFVLTDALGNRGAGRQSNTLGTVDGQEIDEEEFERTLTSRAQNWAVLYQGNEQAYKDYYRDQLWEEVKEDIVIGNRLRELGFNVPQGEYEDMISNPAYPAAKLRGQFTNQQTGQFMVDSALSYIASLESAPQARGHYRDLRSSMARTRRFEKFYNLMGKAMYLTTPEVTDRYHAQNDVANFNYVVKKYTDIPDDQVSYTEEELEAYYEAHKNEPLYKQSASRSVAYIVWPVVPSEADIEEAKEAMNKFKDDFKKTEDDSSFVAMRTQSRFYSESVYNMGDADAEVDSAMAKAAAGDVVGPYMKNEGSVMVLTKVIDPAGADTMFTARHILLKVADGDTAAAEKQLKDYMRQVKNGADFAELAKEHSEGPSGPNGGDLGEFGRGAMVGPFEKKVFASEVGDLSMARTQFGVHLIEVTDRKIMPKFKIVNIEKQVRYTDQTQELVYAKGDEYVAQYTKADSLIAAAERNGITVQRADRLVKTTATLPNLPASEGVLNWVFDKDTKEGDVSNLFEVDDNIVLAMVTDVYEKGVQDYEDVKDAVIARVIQEKKGQKYVGIMDPSKGLSAIATEINSQVQPANNIKFQQFTIPGAGGNEPEVMGMLWTLDAGEVSRAIAGETGVYVIQMQNITPVEPQPADLSSLRQTLSANSAGVVRTQVKAALLEDANIEDNRPRR